MAINIKIANFAGKKGEQVGYLRLTKDGSRMNIGLSPAQVLDMDAQWDDIVAAAHEAKRQADEANGASKPAAKTETKTEAKTAPVTVDQSVILAQAVELLQKDPRFEQFKHLLTPAQTDSSLKEAIASRPKRRAKGAKA